MLISTDVVKLQKSTHILTLNHSPHSLNLQQTTLKTCLQKSGICVKKRNRSLEQFLLWSLFSEVDFASEAVESICTLERVKQ